MSARRVGRRPGGGQPRRGEGAKGRSSAKGERRAAWTRCNLAPYWGVGVVMVARVSRGIVLVVVVVASFVGGGCGSEQEPGQSRRAAASRAGGGPTTRGSATDVEAWVGERGSVT